MLVSDEKIEGPVRSAAHVETITKEAAAHGAALHESKAAPRSPNRRR